MGTPAPGSDSSRGLPTACWLALVATIVLILAVVFNNLSWLAQSQVRYNYDFPIHAEDALDLWRCLTAGDLAGALKVSNYGPVGLLPAAALFSLAGPALGLLYASQNLWLPVYAASLFYLGRRLYGEGAGFLACLYLFTLPFFASITKDYPLEVGCHALSVLAAAVLVSSDFLRWRRASFWFGVVLALGAMAKPEFVAQWILPVAFLFMRTPFESSLSRTGQAWAVAGLVAAGLAAPFGYLALRGPLLALGASPYFPLVVLGVLEVLVILGAWTARCRRPCSQAGNALVAGAALLLALLPYLCVRDLSAILDERVRTALEGTLHGKVWFDPLFYLEMMAHQSFHWLHLVLLTAGLGFALWRGDYRDPGRGLVLGLLAWTFLLVNATAGKFEIYLANILGFAALVATGWAVPCRRDRRALVALLGLWGVFTVFGWALPAPLRPAPPLRHYAGAGSPHRTDEPDYPLPLLAHLPLRQAPVMVPILDDAYARAGGGFLLLVLSAEGDVVHHAWFRVFADYRGIPARIPGDREELQRWGVSRLGTYACPPTFLVVSRKPHSWGTAAVMAGLRSAFPAGPDLQARSVRTYAGPMGREVELFRLSPGPLPSPGPGRCAGVNGEP